MSKILKIILILIVIVFVAGAGYHYFTKTQTYDFTPTEQANNSSSIKGCYVQTTGKDIYTLVIQSEDKENVTGMLAFNNFEKDSSSGSFTGTFSGDILTGTYSFDSEGMHSQRQLMFKKVGNDFIQGIGSVNVVGDKEMFTDPSAVTYDPKLTFVKNDACISHFTDSNNTISFDYNPFFSAREGSSIPTLDWKLNAKQNGTVIANVFVPRGYMYQTNFNDARLIVGRSTDVNAIKNCVVADPNNEKSAGTASVGGYKLNKFTSDGAGAGNFYETTSYRGIVDGDCYSLEYTIHSSNIYNYPPDSGIKEFDKAKIVNEMENIIKSFKFIVNSN